MMLRWGSRPLLWLLDLLELVLEVLNNLIVVYGVGVKLDFHLNDVWSTT